MPPERSPEQIRQALIDVAAMWASGQVNASAVVDVATDALVAGLDTPSLVLLAGTPHAAADTEVRDLLPAAMDELGLPYFGWDGPDSNLLAVATFARMHLDGQLSARDLCRAVHARFGHDAHDLIEPLAVLDDQYDTLAYFQNPTEAQLDRRVLEAASDIITAVETQS